MTVVVTMAGLGSRFNREGYRVRKHRIEAHGQSLFAWSMQSLLAFRDQPLVLATLEDDDAPWLVREAHRIGFNEIRVNARATHSQGQAETAQDALDGVDPAEPLWIYNIDTHVAQGMDPRHIEGQEGCLYVFPCTHPEMSFVRYGKNDHVVLEVAEKTPISNWATVGMYGFSTMNLFTTLYRRGYEEGRIQSTGGERYIAPLYNLLITASQAVVAPRLNSLDIHLLGTPAQLQAFDPLALPPAGNPIRPNEPQTRNLNNVVSST